MNPSSTPQVTSRSAESVASEAGLTLLAAWRVIRKYWMTSLAVTLIVVVTTTFYTLGQTKIYEAAGTLQFDPSPPRPLGKQVDSIFDSGGGTFWATREYYETQYKILQSMRLALSVVQQLNLHRDATFIRNLPPAHPSPPASVSPEDAAEILRSRLSVAAVKESRLAMVRYTDADPERARRILNAILDRYLAQNVEDALSSANAAVDWLHGQLDNLKGELERSEMALHEYKLHKNILSVAFDDQSNMLRDQMKQVSGVLTEVRTKREEASARRDELMQISSDNPSTLPATELLHNVLLQTLRQQYEEALRDREALIAGGKGKEHPDVASIQSRIDTSRTALLNEIRNIQRGVEADLSTVSRQESGLANLLERAKSQALDLNLLEIEYNRLARSKTQTEKLYSLVLERTKESELTQMMRVNNIHVLDMPLLPRSPIRPRVPVNVAIGTLSGLALGIAAALGRGLLDRTVKTPDDLERGLGLPFLGLVPKIGPDGSRGSYYGRGQRRKRQKEVVNRELIVHEQPSSGIAEASRAIRTNLLFMAPDNPHKVLLLTSAGPGEGKTTVACCIAIAMAQAGQRVILVDCDLRRPRIHRIFGRTSDVGVTTELLNDSAKLLRDDLTDQLKTEIPNLSVLPAGPIPPNPAELLHSDRFKTFLSRLSERYDRVIIDSPPIVAVTDAAILSTLVDSTVLVIKAFSTTKEVCRQGIRLLADVGAKTAGTILNFVDLDRHEYKYYHYYYRRYGYYASDPGARGAGAAPAPPPH
ncbi:MAG TPA: polysaccharide biosynthesis tyrosine autokinase [Polyangiaceae bacterium]|nr:polysaccharide biosynthesis tyrosine autokinase [Polyangiaceae bacterium]